MTRLLAVVVMLAASVPVRAQDAAALFDRSVTWDAFLGGVQSQRDRWTTTIPYLGATTLAEIVALAEQAK